MGLVFNNYGHCVNMRRMRQLVQGPFGANMQEQASRLVGIWLLSCAVRALFYQRVCTRSTGTVDGDYPEDDAKIQKRNVVLSPI